MMRIHKKRITARNRHVDTSIKINKNWNNRSTFRCVFCSVNSNYDVVNKCASSFVLNLLLAIFGLERLKLCE